MQIYLIIFCVFIFECDAERPTCQHFFYLCEIEFYVNSSIN